MKPWFVFSTSVYPTPAFRSKRAALLWALRHRCRLAMDGVVPGPYEVSHGGDEGVVVGEGFFDVPF